MEPALRFANDGVTWDTAVKIGTAASLKADGISYHEAFNDMSSGAKRLVQVGVRCKNEAGSAFDGCQAFLDIDIRTVS